MGALADCPGLAEKMGRVAKLYFEQHFAAHVFRENIQNVLCSVSTRDTHHNGAPRRRFLVAALTFAVPLFLLSLLRYCLLFVSRWYAHSYM